MTGLSIANLHKSFANTSVLRGVHLEVPEGTLTAVLGASGSGKTTLLRIVAGFERVGLGEIRLGDIVVESPGAFLPPERRRIGYVSQDGTLFPHLSVWDNVAFGLPRGERKGKKVEGLLELVGLAGFEKRFPHQISGGEQQRVSLARALAPCPRLVLLDEPFSALDATLRVSLRADVREVLRETGVTAVLVTHDQDEAISLADQVAVLRDGAIVQSGTPRQIYERPADLELACFIGNANFIEAVWDKGRAHTAFGVLPVVQGLPSILDGSPILVLLRPEQIDVFPYEEEGPGLAATIGHCDYFGHDAVMTACPLEVSEPAKLILRVPGHRVLCPGTKVRLTFRGEVLAWTRPR
jgi:iron(III) transport system ATP-binding protein